MKLILPGGTGQLGRLLAQRLSADGHACVLLSRTPLSLSPKALGATVRVVSWDGRTVGPWATELDGADAVINLAGRSVDCRYTERNLAVMRASRVDATRAVGLAIAAANRPPRVWLNASTATVYAHTAPQDPPRSEITGPLGGAEPDVPKHWKRSVEIGLAWERELFAAPTPATRRVALRTAMVMTPERGGVFDAFASLCRLGLGHHGDGTAFVSWIHEQDFVNAIRFLLSRADLDGPINLAAPSPLPNREFIAAIHAALERRWPALPVPAWLLEVGAYFRRTETELLLKSRQVVPTRLQAAGFRFEYPTWPEAARDLVERWRVPALTSETLHPN